MKIYTKTGDKGETSLVTGTRVKKYHPRIESYGTVDELNSFLGLLRSHKVGEEVQNDLIWIQNKLFSIAANLSMDDKKISFKIPQVEEEHIHFLEKGIDKMNEELPALSDFILPGGSLAVGVCHVARTVCRRAERLIILLAEENEVDEKVIRFINRLSDYLFVLARKLTKDFNVEEAAWDKEL